MVFLLFFLFYLAEHVMEEGGISNESSCDGLDQVPCATRSVIGRWIIFLFVLAQASTHICMD